MESTIEREDKYESAMGSLISSFSGLNILPRGQGNPPPSCNYSSGQWRPSMNEDDLINGAFVKGFAPLTYGMMIDTPLEQLENMIRIRLISLINPIYPQASGKIAAILLASGIWDCYCMLQNLSYFQAAVEHVVTQLSAE